MTEKTKDVFAIEREYKHALALKGPSRRQALESLLEDLRREELRLARDPSYGGVIYVRRLRDLVGEIQSSVLRLRTRKAVPA